MKVVLATHNKNKLTEFKKILPDWEFLTASDIGVGDVEETGLTYVENAILKARAVAAHTDLPVLGDDSGVEVDALNGMPGIYSARYAENAEARIQKMLHELKDVPWEKRTARYRCVLVMMRYNNDSAPIIVEGVLNGRILFEPKGEHGFGYDPIMCPDGCECSVAELTADEKHQISHRGRAIQALKQKCSVLNLL